MTTIQDVYLGQRVRSTVDASHGRVIDIDYASINVRWDDGGYSIFAKRDGFVGFVPRDLGETA